MSVDAPERAATTETTGRVGLREGAFGNAVALSCRECGALTLFEMMTESLRSTWDSARR